MNWPANLPDFNMIETVWDYIKDSMSQYKIMGASNASKRLSKQACKHEWNQVSIDHFNQLAWNFKDKLCTMQRFQGDNNYHGWLTNIGIASQGLGQPMVIGKQL